jgi:hypothetical protein
MVARLRGKLILPSPKSLYQTSMGLSVWEFQRDALYFAGEHDEKSRSAVNTKAIAAAVKWCKRWCKQFDGENGTATKCNARAGIRTRMGLRPRDFKSEHREEPNTTTVCCHREDAHIESKLPNGSGWWVTVVRRQLGDSLQRREP